MKRGDLILKIAVPSPLPKIFDYLPEDNNQTEYFPGMRVIVPFGRRKLVGMIVELTTDTICPIEKLKPIHSIIDNCAIISEPLLKLFHWVSQYYHYPLGELIFNAIPKKFSIIPKKNKPMELLIPADVDSTVNVTPVETGIKINSAQQQAIESIQNVHKFQIFLLHGITGSGKTEVYLRIMQPILEKGLQVLWLVPEISLITQTMQRIQARYQLPIALWHSQLTEKEKATAWQQIYSQQILIIVGTRSAIFTPLNRCGIIIVDEEHDLSYKQQSGLRYSCRDAAIMRAKLHNIPIVLGSATPSLESIYNAQQKRYIYLSLPERAGQSKLPLMKLIDMRDQKLQNGVTTELITAIQSQLKKNRQVLLFLNRRGYAPLLLCHHCGWTMVCENCDAYMIYHASKHELRCHHCNLIAKSPEICKSCRQSQLIKIGMGTERLQQILKQLFPQENVLRIDRDVTSRKGHLQKLISDIHDLSTRLFVGTQMLTKGHHFSQLGLVAVVDADYGLFSTDFRALERLAQMIIQVAGRAGRENDSGQVLIQTHHPNHPVWEILLHKNYLNTAKYLLQQRKQTVLPPYSYCALFRVEAETAEIAQQFLANIKNYAEKNIGKDHFIYLLGPVPSTMERRAGRYRAQLLLQSQKRNHLNLLLNKITQHLSQLKVSSKIRWALDVDPQEVT